MTFDYAATAIDASALLAEFGAPVPLTRITAGVYDPETGTVVNTGATYTATGARQTTKFQAVDNCHGECEGCNGPYGAKPHQIRAGAIARIGLERYEALEASNAPHKWTHDELREIRDFYRNKLKELKC